MLCMLLCCTQSCPTLWDPMGCSPPGSSVRRISQARILEWVAIPFSRGSFWFRDRTHVSCISCIDRQVLYRWATWEALKIMYQFSSVAQSCLTLCDLMNRSTPGLPVHHQLPESTQTHVHQVGDVIQPSHPLSSPSPPVLSLSQHPAYFQASCMMWHVSVTFSFLFLNNSLLYWYTPFFLSIHQLINI